MTVTFQPSYIYISSSGVRYLSATAGLRDPLRIINFLCVYVKYISKYVCVGVGGSRRDLWVSCVLLYQSALSPWDLQLNIRVRLVVSNHQPYSCLPTNPSPQCLPYRCIQPRLIFAHILGTQTQITLLAQQALLPTEQSPQPLDSFLISSLLPPRVHLPGISIFQN